MSDGALGGPFGPRDRAWHPPALAPEYKSSIYRSPQQPLLQMPQGPAELSGPVFGHDLLGAHDADLTLNHAAPGESAIGERCIVHGFVLDEAARPVANTLVEIWQANAGGRYRHANDGYTAPLDPNFGGCGRVITGEDGSYRFMTIKPAPYPWPNGPNSWRPAHIHFSLFGHAFAQRLITQMYFEGDPLIPLCPIAGAIPSEAARQSLVASLDMDTTQPFDAMAYRFDLVLRGRTQTLFEGPA